MTEPEDLEPIGGSIGQPGLRRRDWPARGVVQMKSVLAMVLAGGQGERLSILSEERAKPAVPFAGKYRMIDFSLSNCVNSGINNVAILTQYRPRSLNEHIGIGKPWDLDRREGGVRLLQPFLGRRDSDWYRGTADAVYQNLSYVEEQGVDQVLILSGDHIYKMDYRDMLRFHEQKGADLTVAVTEVPLSEASRFGILTVDSDGRAVGFQEKPQEPQGTLISMGVYLFNREVLLNRLEEDAEDAASAHDFGRSILPMMVGRDRVFTYPFSHYWRDVGTVRSYWEANMDLLARPPAFNLYDEWTIFTKSEERAPAILGGKAQVVNSLVSHGCIIDGRVEHSILSPGVRVAEGATVKDSIVMTDSVIGRDAIIDYCIIDKGVIVEEGCHLGCGDDCTPNFQEPSRLNSGLTVVGKAAHIAARVKVGRNCKVCPRTRPEDFPGAFVESGGTVETRKARSRQRRVLEKAGSGA